MVVVVVVAVLSSLDTRQRNGEKRNERRNSLSFRNTDHVIGIAVGHTRTHTHGRNEEKQTNAKFQFGRSTLMTKWAASLSLAKFQYFFLVYSAEFERLGSRSDPPVSSSSSCSSSSLFFFLLMTLCYVIIFFTIQKATSDRWNFHETLKLVIFCLFGFRHGNQKNAGPRSLYIGNGTADSAASQALARIARTHWKVSRNK